MPNDKEQKNQDYLNKILGGGQEGTKPFPS